MLLQTGFQDGEAQAERVAAAATSEAAAARGGVITAAAAVSAGGRGARGDRPAACGDTGDRGASRGFSVLTREG